MMRIKGIQKMCLIDFPPYTSCILFIAGCNFKCPYCHNAELVEGYKETPDMDEEKVMAFLETRKEWLDAVVITGGEPTLYPELKELIKKIKEKGFMVKLDTNGTMPENLKKLLPLIDYVAMDIKAPLEKYHIPTRVDVNTKKIQESIELLKNGKIDYEFRTTVLPEFFSEEDAKAIGKLINGCKKYVLQQFRPTTTLDETYKDKKGYSKEELEKFSEIMKEYAGVVEVRGTI